MWSSRWGTVLRKTAPSIATVGALVHVHPFHSPLWCMKDGDESYVAPHPKKLLKRYKSDTSAADDPTAAEQRCTKIMPGSDKDLYIPQKNVNKKDSAPVWAFFRKRHSDDASKINRAWCQLAGCKKAQVAMNGTSTSNLITHLKGKHHALTDLQIIQEHQRQNEARANREEVKLRVYGEGEDEEDRARQAKRNRQEEQETKASLKATATIGTNIGHLPVPRVLAPLGVGKTKSCLDQAFARAFCGSHLRPTTIGEGVEIEEFFRLLLQSTGATHLWKPPCKKQISQILGDDVQDVCCFCS